MSDVVLAGELPFPPRPDYLRAGSTLASWLTTTDHKRIAILYALTITVFFFTRSRTATWPVVTLIRVPSQRSTVCQRVPLIVAAA